MKTLKTDVIIPAYRPGEEFEKLLERLSAQKYPINKILVMNTEKKFWKETWEQEYPLVEVQHLTKEEFDNLRSQIVTSSYGGTRYMPFAFTEQGVAMLSSVLNSKKAIEVNIAIMRTFVVLRNSILSLDEITNRVSEIEQQFPEIYKALNYLMDTHQKNTEQKERSKIGFKKK